MFRMLMPSIVSLSLGAAVPAVESLDLSGTWRFALDRDDQGQTQGWQDRTLDGQVQLPGSLAVQRIGDVPGIATQWIGNSTRGAWGKDPRYAAYRTDDTCKVSFWLQPDRVWIKPAWYQRDLDIPAEWAGKRLQLSLERVHIASRVWLDGKEVGTCNSLSTAHVYDLGTTVAAGRHVLTIRIDNRDLVDVGSDSHSVSDHTQGAWNGAVGRIELCATTPVWLQELRTIPHAATRSVTVNGTVGNAGGRTGSGHATLNVHGPGISGVSIQVPVTWSGSGGSFTADIPLGDQARQWDEFSPAVYTVEATLAGSADADHHLAATFGLREIAAHGRQLLINGRPLFLRGTLECCIFPKTGHPPTGAAEWRRIYGVIKDHGLNHVRFHSWCPPEVAFQVADEMGLYLQVECASWANGSTTIGDGKPVDAWVYQEAERILASYGNHPSFILMLYGNEPGGKQHPAYLARWVETFKAKDPRRLYSSGSGWPQLRENQFHVDPHPRVQAWGEGLKSRINAKPPETTTDYRAYLAKSPVPVISHEIGQWCVFPNLAERSKYTGHLKAKNFDIFADFLEQAGMADQAHDFLIASGKLQTLCYKEDIEAALRTPSMGGFQLLDLHDFPGQGTALVGVLDPFWDSKGYVTPGEYRRFCNSTVPLARLATRVFTTADHLKAGLEIAHYGAAPITAAPRWRLVADDGRVAASGSLPEREIPVGGGIALGDLDLALDAIPAPARYRLELSVGTVANDWDVWVYPAQVPTAVPEGVLVTTQMDDKAASTLAAGGRVVWNLPAAQVRTPAKGPIQMGFSTIFWNTDWTKGQAPHTMGVLCKPDHPLFASFPTDAWSSWQWWYLMHATAPLLCDDLPKTLRPTVQVIDDWFTCHRIGLAVEAAVGPGRLLVTSIPLEATDPVSRQFRRSLLDYAAGPRFAPSITVTLDQIRVLEVTRKP